MVSPGVCADQEGPFYRYIGPNWLWDKQFSILHFWLGRYITVVTPLLALMTDQEGEISSNFKDLTAAHLEPDVDSNEVLQRVREGDLQIVFVTPESYIANLAVWSADRPFFNAHFGAIVIDEAQDLVLVDNEFRHDFAKMELR